MDELDKHTNRNPFKVPDNYFDNFSDRLKEKVHDKTEIPIRKALINSLKPFIAIAASFLIIYTFWFLIVGDKYKPNVIVNTSSELIEENYILESIETVELIDIIANNANNMDEAEYITDENIDDILRGMDISTIIESID